MFDTLQPRLPALHHSPRICPSPLFLPNLPLMPRHLDTVWLHCPKPWTPMIEATGQAPQGGMGGGKDSSELTSARFCTASLSSAACKSLARVEWAATVGIYLPALQPRWGSSRIDISESLCATRKTRTYVFQNSTENRRLTELAGLNSEVVRTQAQRRHVPALQIKSHISESLRTINK